MNGLMMDYPLTLSTIFRRAETLFRRQEIVWRAADKSIHRYTCADFADRARRLAQVLLDLGITPGDRVATLGWNHGPHLEAYFGIPLMGGVLHTLNLRLHPDELAYIVNHAEDRAILVDESLLPLWEQVKPKVNVPIVIVVGASQPVADGYLRLRGADREDAARRRSCPIPTSAPPRRCATRPARPATRKACCTRTARSCCTPSACCSSQGMGLRERDTVLPVVPMFHANAWGMPFGAIMVGAKFVMPGPHLDPASLVDLFVRERVTLTGGVPTIWMGVLQYLDANPGKFDLSAIRAMYVGGSAVPQALIEAFERRYGLRILQAWGMTELAPLGTVGAPAAGDGRRAPTRRSSPTAPSRDGRRRSSRSARATRTASSPGTARRWASSKCAGRGSPAATTTGPTPPIASPTMAGSAPATSRRSTPTRTIQIQDRSKDLIKSGGEWISSVALECALMGHPAVAEAAVIPVASAKWIERPLAAVVLKPGATASPQELKAFLAPQFAKFWLPDDFEFVDAIPRTSAGKFKKSELRDQFKDYQAAE